MKRNRIIIATLVTVAIGLVIASLLVVSFRWRHRSDPVTFGITFSAKYAQDLGLDWGVTYQALLSELDFEVVRLMSYWDHHEPADNEFDFATLDAQFDLAAAHGKQVSLAIGLRQPRWPECHSPDWADQLDAKDRRAQLLEYIKVVVERYRDHPALATWQLENEVANRSFGDCPDFDRRFLARELALAESLDPDHPVIINASNQSGIPLVGPIASKVGFSVYRHAYFDLLGAPRKWSFWYLPASWHSLRASLVELRGADTFIHELQAEPWGAKPTQAMTLAEQNKLMDDQTLRRHVDYALATGIREIHLWGGEYWYWRREKFGDDSLWNAARAIMNEQQNPQSAN